MILLQCAKTSICYHFRRVCQHVFERIIGLSPRSIVAAKPRNMKQELPLSLKLIRGAIGKEFVIKHYRDGAVRTKYPDMSGIVASPGQRKCRNLFKEAGAYARLVIVDTERKTSWQKTLRKRNSVYNEAIKEYMLREKKAKQKEMIVTNRLLRKAMMNCSDEIISMLNISNSEDPNVSRSYFAIIEADKLCSGTDGGRKARLKSETG